MEVWKARRVSIYPLLGDRYRVIRCFRVGCNQWARAEIETEMEGTGRIKREYRCGPCLRVWQELNKIDLEYD